MTKFSKIVLAAVALGVSAPALAQGDLDISKNQTVYDAEGNRIAKVTRVLEDGSVLIIYRGKAIRLGAETLSLADDKLATTLTKREISRLD